MKKLNRLSNGALLLFIAGLAMQYFHLPGGGLVLLLSVVYSFIFLIIKAAVGGKKDPLIKENLMVHSGVFLFLSYLVFRVMFWGFTKMIFPLMLIAIILGLLVLFSKKYRPLPTWIIWFVLLFAALGTTQVRSYQIYEVKYSELIEAPDASYYSISTLDRYAWFLNLAKKYEEAEVALNKAIELYEAMEADGQDHMGINVFNISKEKLLEHQEQLDKREWKNFP